MNYKSKVRAIYPRATWRFTVETSYGGRKIKFWIDLNRDHHFMYPPAKNLELAWKNAYENCEKEFLKRLEQ